MVKEKILSRKTAGKAQEKSDRKGIREKVTIFEQHSSKEVHCQRTRKRVGESDSF